MINCFLSSNKSMTFNYFKQASLECLLHARHHTNLSEPRLPHPILTSALKGRSREQPHFTGGRGVQAEGRTLGWASPSMRGRAEFWTQGLWLCVLYSFQSIAFTPQLKTNLDKAQGDQGNTIARVCGWLHIEAVFIRAVVLGPDGTTLPLTRAAGLLREWAV